jgi:hypothetical protein
MSVMTNLSRLMKLGESIMPRNAEAVVRLASALGASG